MATPSGEQATAAPERQDGAAPRIRTIDFSQPTKFTSEIRKRIAGALESFCEELSAELSSELHSEVELSVGEVAQHTWAAAKARLAADSVAVAVQEGEIARHMLLSVELGLTLQALECLLGASAAQAPAHRHLSEIDWALVKDLCTRIVAELSSAWEELGGPPLRRGEVDVEGDAGVLTPVGEPTLSVALTSTIDGVSSSMSLLIPWAVIEPIAASIRSAGTAPRGRARSATGCGAGSQVHACCCAPR